MGKRDRTLLRAEEKRISAGDPFFRKAWFLWVFTLVAVGMDSISLFSTFDDVFGDTVIMTVALTGGISLILNVLPSVAGFIITSDRHPAFKVCMSIVIAVIFGSFFLFTYELRMASAQVSFVLENITAAVEGSNLASGLVEQTQISQDILNDQERRHRLANLIVAMEPLLTSVGCFVLSLVSNQQASRFSVLKQQEIRLSRLASRLESQIQQLERASTIGVMEHAEEEDFSAVRKSIQHRCDQLRWQGRMMLARRLGNARALSHLSKTRS